MHTTPGKAMREIGRRLKKEIGKGTPINDVMVRVAFKDRYAYMEIVDGVRVALEPANARELALASQ
jgi:hypothetical protein